MPILKSNLSLRYGTIPIEELAALALDAGHETVVLADINNTSGIPDLLSRAGR
ncbi:MAG: hypothetical protein ACKOGP_00165 [Bacteroidota bacterium]